MDFGVNFFETSIASGTRLIDELRQKLRFFLIRHVSPIPTIMISVIASMLPLRYFAANFVTLVK